MLGSCWRARRRAGSSAAVVVVTRLALIALALALGAVGCGGAGDIGESCGNNSDCGSGLQCVDHTCVLLCDRHIDCGDGFICNDHVCEQVNSVVNDPCLREVDCGPGQSCQLDSRDPDGDDLLEARCGLDRRGGVAGSECTEDGQCRNGACAVGHCVDICVNDSDCPADDACASLPRLLTGKQVGYYGCLPRDGILTFPLDVDRSNDRLWVPVPGHTRSLTLVSRIKKLDELVGATAVVSPSGQSLYSLPTTPAQFYANLLRHRPTPGVSVLMIPNTTAIELEPGLYEIDLATIQPDGTPGSVPEVTAIYKFDDEVDLDLHFHFMDLSDHACLPAFAGSGALSAATAAESGDFQGYLQALRIIFGRAGIVIGSITYDDLFDPAKPHENRSDLYNLRSADLGDLLALTTQEGGVNIVFVRTISPAGTQALVGGNPGPPGIPGTIASGVALSVDTLCYRGWSDMARVTSHEIARHLGLYRNREPDGATDPIPDSDTSTDNLMFFGEFGGTDFSDGQRQILWRSAVLR